LPPLRGSLDQPQTNGAAQLDLVRHTHRASLRDSNSARLNLRLSALDRGGAQGKGEVCGERITKLQTRHDAKSQSHSHAPRRNEVNSHNRPTCDVRDFSYSTNSIPIANISSNNSFVLITPSCKSFAKVNTSSGLQASFPFSKKLQSAFAA
jgi:hypothetical protein